MFKKLFGVFFTLISFFGSMLLAFGAEFLVDVNCVFFGLIFLSLGFLILGIVLCKKGKFDLLIFCVEIIITEFILAVIIIPTGLWEKFIIFRDQFHSDWGLIWVVYPFFPAIALFLIAVISGVMGYFRYLSKSKNKG